MQYKVLSFENYEFKHISWSMVWIKKKNSIKNSTAPNLSIKIKKKTLTKSVWKFKEKYSCLSLDFEGLFSSLHELTGVYEIC